MADVRVKPGDMVRSPLGWTWLCIETDENWAMGLLLWDTSSYHAKAFTQRYVYVNELNVLARGCDVDA